MVNKLPRCKECKKFIQDKKYYDIKLCSFCFKRKLLLNKNFDINQVVNNAETNR